MIVEAETKCPICNSPATCIFFHIKAVSHSRLKFRCGKCKLIFEAFAMIYNLEKKKSKITFGNISPATEVLWNKKGFNPSER